MKKYIIILLALVALQVQAKTYNYVWTEVYPNYKQQIPSSDFTLDNLFQINTEMASGVSGPQFVADNKAGLMLRTYANNTLQIKSLGADAITQITFVIGGNGCASLAKVTPSNGAMDEPYLGRDASDSFREYRYTWKGKSKDITFSVGAKCEFGYECMEQGKTDTKGTLMTKAMIIETDEQTGLKDIQGLKVGKKVIIDGKMYIQYNDGIYDVFGRCLEHSK